MSMGILCHIDVTFIYVASTYCQCGKHLLFRCYEYFCHMVRIYPKDFFMFTIARLTCSLLTPTSSPLTLMHSLNSYVGEVQKFPKVGLSNVISEKWLHKATF